MTIFQQCLKAGKKKYQFYKIAVFLAMLLMGLTIYYFNFYQPKKIEIKEISSKIKFLTQQLKEMQEEKLKLSVKQHDQAGSMPHYLNWLSVLLDKAGIQYSEISQLKLADSSLPVIRFRVKLKANPSRWFAFVNYLLQSKAILITDFKYQDSQAASVDLIMLMDESLEAINFLPIEKNLNHLLCSSEWYVEQEDLK